MKIFKYFFEFITVISFFCIFKIVGLKNASNLGGAIGKLFGPLFRSRDITQKNIRIGLGEISEKEVDDIINGMWSNIGRTFAEYIFLKNFKFNKMNFNHIEINGTEYLDSIKKNNQSQRSPCICKHSQKIYAHLQSKLKKQPIKINICTFRIVLGKK